MPRERTETGYTNVKKQKKWANGFRVGRREICWRISWSNARRKKEEKNG